MGHEHAEYGANTAKTQSREVILTPIEQVSSLSSVAYEHIKAAIIVGDIVPGPLYTVSQFASALGVSRTPVREALLMLAHQGILEMERNRGFRLGAVTEQELDEIIEIRMMIEVAAMQRLASLNPSPADVFRNVRQIYQQLQDAADRPDVLEFMRLDRKFHIELTAALGNKNLTTLVGDLRDRMHLPGLRFLANGGLLHESGVEHDALLQALERGNSQEAGEIMQRHLRRTQHEWKIASIAESYLPTD